MGAGSPGGSLGLHPMAPLAAILAASLPGTLNTNLLGCPVYLNSAVEGLKTAGS